MPLAQEKHYTYADYLSWDEQERIELIQGQPNMMAPPSRAHQKACGELFRQIANYLDGKNVRRTLRRLPSGCSKSRTMTQQALTLW